MPQMIHLCEHCRRACADLRYDADLDEYWCNSCLDNRAEAAYERQCESFHDGGDTSWPDAQRIREAEARKLK